MKYIPFSLKEYYLWRKKTDSRYPWKRQFLNQEFLKYEIKRIKELDEWYHKIFLKSDENKNLEEVSFYTIPVELSTSWKGSIASAGNFNFIGLSALQNSPEILLLALLPYTIKQSDDYRLINIKKSKKLNLVNKRTNIIQPVLIIEEWEYLPADKIYVDISYEKRIVQNLIEENLIHDKQLSLSFQSPVISAPYVHNSIGGISLSSISGSSPFAMELAKTIQFMVPPEYRALVPPEGAFFGSKFSLVNGIKFHLAERPYFDNNFMSCVYDTSYSGLAEELLNRRKFSGEYSIFSTINPSYGNFTQIWRELLKNFTLTEITIPENLDTLPEIDVDLTRMRRVIDEDLWLQVVDSRQFKPAFNKEADKSHIKTVNQLKRDFDVILAGVHKNPIEREFLIRSMLHNIQYNLRRMVQSFARSEQRNELTSNDFPKARNLIVDNFNGFVNHPEFERIKTILYKKKNDARYSVVQGEIINNPASSAREIYDSVKSTKLFQDIYDLQKFLDWLHEKGFVIVGSNRRYYWIGK